MLKSGSSCPGCMQLLCDKTIEHKAALEEASHKCKINTSNVLTATQFSAVLFQARARQQASRAHVFAKAAAEQPAKPSKVGSLMSDTDCNSSVTPAQSKVNM